MKLSQWAKSTKKKQSVWVYFDNMALYFECQINNNDGDFADWDITA